MLRALACLALAGMASAAWANGQTSHLWISDHALSHLPEGELRELLLRQDLRVMLDSGTMFPDGGYAVDHPYGESAHWEGLQAPYLEWIRAEHEPPWTDEAAQHIAFLMGMASHGMADQVFDSNYMERARVYDAESPWETESMDEATDVAYAAARGGWEIDGSWLPAEALVPLFAQHQAIEVDADTLESGQGLLEVAVWFVGQAAQNPETVAEYEAQWPWATTHQLEDVPGAPECEGRIIAEYWQALYRRLREEPAESALLASLPPDGGWAHPAEAESIESMVSMVFARGLDAAPRERFEVLDETGAAHEVSVDLFYGSGSHVVNIRPVSSWSVDTSYEVRALPGLVFRDGSELEAPVSFGFSTRVPPMPDLDPEPPNSAGCAQLPGLWWSALLGLLPLCRRRSADRPERPRSTSAQ